MLKAQMLCKSAHSSLEMRSIFLHACMYVRPYVGMYVCIK